MPHFLNTNEKCVLLEDLGGPTNEHTSQHGSMGGHRLPSTKVINHPWILMKTCEQNISTLKMVQGSQSNGDEKNVL